MSPRSPPSRKIWRISSLPRISFNFPIVCPIYFSPQEAPQFDAHPLGRASRQGAEAGRKGCLTRWVRGSPQQRSVDSRTTSDTDRCCAAAQRRGGPGA
jgi:hypothetical protein